MHKWLGVLGALLIAFGIAWAQVVPQPGPPTPIACAYNTTPPTLTNGQAGWAQCDSTGKIITSGSGGGSLSATATAAAPSYIEGSSDPLSMDLNGNTRVIATGLAQGSATPGQTGSLVLCAVSTSPISYTTGQSSPCQLDLLGNIRVAMTSQYPSNAVPYTASATGTTGATTATLAAAGAATSYICGFSIRANATAAATNNATVTGTISGTLNFTQWTAPLASGLGITEMIFTPCLPGSAANQAIAVVSGAPGSGGVVSVSAWGYKL